MISRATCGHSLSLRPAVADKTGTGAVLAHDAEFRMDWMKANAARLRRLFDISEPNN
jgi:hypothetical protein